jgi:hypothetical protein
LPNGVDPRLGPQPSSKVEATITCRNYHHK